MPLLNFIVRDMLEMMRPLRTLEHHLRASEDIYRPFLLPRILRYPERSEIEYQTSDESIIQDKKKFEIKLDLQNYTPEEITVKTVNGNSILIEGKQEKKDDKGFITRQFARQFTLPEGHDVKDVVSSLSFDGVLTVTAPKKLDAQLKERKIPISHVGPEGEKLKIKEAANE